jgi:hypothetical protein
MVRFQYRIAVAGEYQQYTSLRLVEKAASDLDADGVQTRIEYRRVDQPQDDEWVPLAWEDTLAGRLGYPVFPGYGAASASGGETG